MARQLGQALAETAEFRELVGAELDLRNDPEGARLLAEMERLAQEPGSCCPAGRSHQADESLRRLEQEAGGNPAWARYRQAQERFDRLLWAVNAAFSHQLTWGDEGSPPLT